MDLEEGGHAIIFFVMKSTTLRRFLLITLRNAETRGLKAEDLRDRILSSFTCQVIAIAKDKVGSVTIGVLSKSASKHTFRQILRTVFCDFLERDFQVECRKAWRPVCQALSKEGQKVLLVWGETPVLERKLQKKLKILSDAPETKKKRSRIRSAFKQVYWNQGLSRWFTPPIKWSSLKANP